jgi:lipoprotein NlpD
MKNAALVVLALLLAACAARQPAPVVERMQLPEPAPEAAPPEPAPPPVVEKPIPTHVVKKGDTLVSIALQYGLDYRELAAWNNMTNKNALKIGQVLVLAPPPGSAPAPAAPAATGPIATPLLGATPIEGRPLANTDATKVEPRAQKLPFSDRALAQLSAGDPPPGADAPNAAPTTPGPSAATEAPRTAGTDKEDIDWMWPVKGKLIAPFTESSKGVDLSGRKGAPVMAASAGRVIYADEGLRGYGKLVIIRHNDTWLSAYAHNDKLLVKEQDEVKKGQKIAEMGSTGTDQVKLHFEVRRQGKPVDPAKVLPPM